MEFRIPILIVGILVQLNPAEEHNALSTDDSMKLLSVFQN